MKVPTEFHRAPRDLWRVLGSERRTSPRAAGWPGSRAFNLIRSKGAKDLGYSEPYWLCLGVGGPLAGTGAPIPTALRDGRWDDPRACRHRCCCLVQARLSAPSCVRIRLGSANLLG